jgi:multidrug efflux pump subunit AcrA (membrane-fusion protein)
MIRKFLLPVLAIAGLGLAFAMVIRGGREAPAAQTAVQSSSAPFESYIFGPGIVEASTENIAVGTPVSGIVTAVYVKWGDQVKSGDPLFKVDTRDLEAQLLTANAKVREVEAQLLPAAAKVKEVEAQLPSANAKVNEAEAALAKTENRLKVGEALELGVSVTVEEMANRRFDVGINKASLASAEAQVRQIQTQIASVEAQAEQIRPQIASAKAQVEQIQHEIGLRTIRAPVAGRILQMKTRPGEYAQSGVLSTPLMVLGDDTTLHVRLDIDENDAWRFQTCAAAVAFVRGNPQIKTSLQYVRTDPNVIPKVALTGDTTQRTDTRVLQVIYSFNPASLPLYVGQLMDVFIDGAGPCSDTGRAQSKDAGRQREKP